MKNAHGIWLSHRVLRGLLLAGLVSLWLSACATPPLPPGLEAEDQAAKQFTADPENATIYIFRQSYSILFIPGSWAEGMAGFNVLLHIDGQEIGALKPKEFLRMVVPPGPHDIVAINAQTRRQARISLDVEKGGLYFVEVMPFVSRPGSVDPRLGLRPPAVMAVEAKTGKRAVLDGTVVVVEKGPKVVR